MLPDRYLKYGAFYADELQDAMVASRLLQHLKLPRFQAAMVLEGGSVHGDGEGCEGLLNSCY